MRFVFKIILILVLGVVITAITDFGRMTGPDYTYQKEVHGYFENAYYANNPELMKSQLQLAISGMHKLGLDDEMYCVFWNWEKTPDRQMKYQYAHLDGIIDRIDSVIVWYEKNYENNITASETLGDVYEEKMDNLRYFLREDGWSDWIAKGTFYINYHLFYYFLFIPMILMWTSIIIMCFVMTIKEGLKNNWF